MARPTNLASKTQYDNFAPKYDTIEDLPISQLESQLIRSALGSDLHGQRVLDLGGGSGLHARKAVVAGAALIDIVDVSPAMLATGQETMQELLDGSALATTVRWFEGDITRSLDHLPELQKESYDIVMANWVFDHAGTLDDLEAMWATAAAHVKPGGKFLGVRVANPRADALKTGKYGVTYEDVEDIPGGVKYRVVYLTEQRFPFEGTSMEASWTGKTDIPQRVGFVDVRVERASDTEVVKSDPEFWAEHLRDPYFVLVTAKKLP